MRHTRFDCDWSSDVCSSDLGSVLRHRARVLVLPERVVGVWGAIVPSASHHLLRPGGGALAFLEPLKLMPARSEEHTSELQSQSNLVCRLLLEKKKVKLFDQI